MKRLVIFLAIMSVLLFACSIAATPTQPVSLESPTATLPPVNTQPVVATEAPTATKPPAATQPPVATQSPVETQPPVPPTNTTCSELSLFLDPALASGYTCETIPAVTDGMEHNPQYTQLTLSGYPLSDKFFSPHISVYSVQDFTALLPDQIPSEVAALQALLGGGATGTASLPFLPIFPAAQVFHAQYRQLPFQSGAGVRYMTIFAQYFAPVNNHDLFYTYQGLTSDGTYWVSAILPINHPTLPENADNPPGGVTWEEFSNNYDSYTVEMSSQLNSQTADSFTPSLNALDGLVASILVQP